MPSLSVLLPAALAFISLPFVSSQAAAASRPSCRCLPTDSCWPKEDKWAKLNQTVGGRLIATVPVAAPCHDPTFNAAECQNIKDLWAFPNLHLESPSSIMNPWQQNGSCDPFTPQSTPCTLGNYVDYSIKVSSWQDAAVGIKFAEKHNIRLVIKNTGHDYLGKSTGTGALGLWTHNLKSPQVISKYNSSYYNGPALKLGAGTISVKALQAASPAGLRVVAGSCPSVGIAGGYTQGAGHSVLSSQYGLGADQVLEWEVVTANGKRVIATPRQNTDLYFALSGGGPGTYGVVISMTVRAHQDGPVSSAVLSFAAKGTSKEAYWKAIAAWHTQLPALVDSGAAAVYLITADGFLITPITAPDKSADEVAKMLDPFTKTLTSLNITYTVNTTSESTYLAHFVKYFGPVPYSSHATAQLLGGRLVPRRMIERNNEGLTQAFREITENSTFYIAATALDVRKPKATKPISDNAVLPAWREALLLVLVPSPWDFTVPRSVEEERESQLTNSLIPKLAAVTPNSGTYLNEADFHLASWKEDFYGANYSRLRSLKAKYDPGNLFYATTAVGSDAWKVADDGRMCRA